MIVLLSLGPPSPKRLSIYRVSAGFCVQTSLRIVTYSISSFMTLFFHLAQCLYTVGMLNTSPCFIICTAESHALLSSRSFMFIHYSVSGHLSCFPFGWYEYWHCEHLCGQVFSFLVYKHEGGIAPSMWNYLSIR